VLNSGKVTPKKHLKAGYSQAGNFPTQTIGSIYNNFESVVTSLVNEDTIVWNTEIENLNKTAISYSLDPVSWGTQYYIRYGIIEKFDVGYKNAGGANVFDLMYQFKGSTGTFKNPGDSKFYGSVGLQFSSQDFKLPKIYGELQDILGFKFERKDITVPLIFSKSFGKEEKIGCLAYGLTASYSFIKYGYNVSTAYEFNQNFIKIPEKVEYKKNFASFGAFINLKIGYRFVYFLPSLAIYYQKYGNYELLNGNTVKLKGLTFVPSFGIHFTIPLIKSEYKKD
jgi:hypothetical protein